MSGFAAAAGSGAAGAGAGAGANAAMYAGAASGALSSLVNLGLGVAGLVQNRKQYDQARADQAYYYEDQKNWNSPQNQMYLRSLAGLNPYGDFVANSPGTPSPVDTTASYNESLSLIGSGLSHGADSAFKYLSQKLAFAQLRNELKKTELSEKLTDAQVDLISKQASAADIVNWVADQTKEQKVSMAYYEAQDALYRSLISHGDYSWQSVLKNADYEYLLEQIANLRQSREISKESWEFDKKGLRFNTALYDSIDNIINRVTDDPSINAGTKAALQALFFIVKSFVSYKNSSKH